MQARIPAYEDHTGQSIANTVDDLGTAQPARDPAYDVGHDDSRWDDDQESSNRQGRSGMSLSESEAPKEEGSLSAAEAAKSRSFRALRTAKACDCDGGDPCAPCRVHNSICIYSKTTRKKLLSLSESNARNGQSVIPKNTRGRPMTTDLGNWTQGGRHRFRIDLPIDETAIPIDPLFLPSQLAHRFFHAFTVMIHPLYPVVNLDQVRGSISDAYAGSVNYRPNPATRPSEHARNMHKARDFMVLALGAQIEGGDGDAHCPKEVARAWSKHLADQAHELLTNSRENGAIDAIRIWLLYTVYLGNYGQIDEQYVAVGHAARLVTSLGLHREPTCNLSEPKDEGLRELFWTTYIMEKTISLWQGRPSSLNVQHEIDTALPTAGEIKLKALRSMVDLVDTVEKVHAIYLNQNRDVTKQSAYNKVNAIFAELDVVRRSVGGELRGFESVDLQSPGSLVALDTPEGQRALFKFRLSLLYHNLRMLASLPLLSFLVWQGVSQLRASVDQQVLSVLAGECVASAEATILAFNVYLARIPYLPFMSDFASMLLYAIPIIYLDSLRYDRTAIPRRNVDAMRLVAGVLQHFDHPAADVCKAMLQDFFDNHMRRPEWSSPSMQLQNNSMDNPAGSNELLSWLTGPHNHGPPRTNLPQ
ncbi:hypothetical protein NCC49_002428 [Naganishia albida]|nr:hypothetical protein NCC49_002428 [Naganishia albida]